MNLNQLWNKKPLFEEPGEPAAGGEPDATPAPQTDAAPEPEAPDFSFVPEQFRTEAGVDAGGFQLYLEELQGTKAQLDERLADVPEAADGYEFGMPDDVDYGDDLVLPENFSINIASDDADMKPLFGELGAFMHQHGIPKAAAPQVMGLLAKYEATQTSRQMVAHEGEMKALGEGAPARVARLQRTIEAKLPEEQAKAILGATKSAAGVRALETLFSPKSMNSTTPEPPEPKQTSSAAARYPTSVAS